MISPEDLLQLMDQVKETHFVDYVLSLLVYLYNTTVPRALPPMDVEKMSVQQKIAQPPPPLPLATNHIYLRTDRAIWQHPDYE